MKVSLSMSGATPAANACIHFMPSASVHMGIASWALAQPASGTGRGFPAMQIQPFVPSRAPSRVCPVSWRARQAAPGPQKHRPRSARPRCCADLPVRPRRRRHRAGATLPVPRTLKSSWAPRLRALRRRTMRLRVSHASALNTSYIGGTEVPQRTERNQAATRGRM